LKKNKAKEITITPREKVRFILPYGTENQYFGRQGKH